MKKYGKLLTGCLTTAALCSAMAFTAFADEPTEVQTGWVETDEGWVYLDEDGYEVTDEWKKSGDNWFYLDDDGHMVYEQLVEHEGYIYYANEDGAMVKNQWVQLPNEDNDEYSEENAAVDVWYYFQNNGRAYVAGDNGTSFKTINGQKYAFDEDGKMLWGWVNDNSELCNSGTEWHDAVYYCGAENDGARKSGWYLIDVEEDRENLPKNKDNDTVMYYYFYFTASGKRVQDTIKTINGLKYSFDEYGAMDYEWTLATDSVASPAVASASVYQFFNYEDYGNRLSGWFYTIPGENLHKKDYDDELEHWYYASSGGELTFSQIKSINGKKYAFNEYGEMLYGLQALKLNPDDPTIIEGNYMIDDEDEWDAFVAHSNYSGDDGDFDFNGSLLYYFGDEEDGAMKLGKVKVEFTGDTYNYYFIKTGTYKGAGFGSWTGYEAELEGTYDVNDDGEKSFIDDGKYIYLEGRRIEADENLRYEPFTAFGEEAKSDDDVTDGNFYLVNTSGSIQKRRHNVKDQDGSYYCTDDNGIITYYGDEKCKNHNDDAKHE